MNLFDKKDYFLCIFCCCYLIFSLANIKIDLGKLEQYIDKTYTIEQLYDGVSKIFKATNGVIYDGYYEEFANVEYFEWFWNKGLPNIKKNGGLTIEIEKSNTKNYLRFLIFNNKNTLKL